MTARDNPPESESEPEPEPEPDAAPKPARPSHDQLYREVGLVRTRGLANLAAGHSDLLGLLAVAKVIGSGTDDGSKIEDALRRAASRLGGMGTSAVEILLGLTPDTRSLSVTERRTRAAAAYGFKTYEVFRTRFEPSLLMFVATYLSVLVDERRLAQRVHIIESRYRQLSADNPPDPHYIQGTEQIQWLPIYHFIETSRYGGGDIYSMRREFVVAYRAFTPSKSKLMRLLKRPVRTYEILGGIDKGFYEGTRVYQVPSWPTRTYRNLLIKMLRIG